MIAAGSQFIARPVTQLYVDATAAHHFVPPVHYWALLFGGDLGLFQDNDVIGGLNWAVIWFVVLVKELELSWDCVFIFVFSASIHTNNYFSLELHRKVCNQFVF